MKKILGKIAFVVIYGGLTAMISWKLVDEGNGTQLWFQIPSYLLLGAVMFRGVFK
jgi:hypothetical protein